jgi:hypothetical protein
LISEQFGRGTSREANILTGMSGRYRVAKMWRETLAERCENIYVVLDLYEHRSASSFCAKRCPVENEYQLKNE